MCLLCPPREEAGDKGAAYVVPDAEDRAGHRSHRIGRKMGGGKAGGKAGVLHLIKAMVFPVVMYGCDSWTVKKAECRRIDALDCGVGEDS